MLAWLALFIGVLGVTALILLRLRQTLFPATSRDLAGGSAVFDHLSKPSASVQTVAAVVSFLTPSIVDAHTDYYKLAFGVRSLDYRIFDPHDQILAQVTQALPEAISEQRHFPRRPSLLPKLLRVMNAKDSSRDEIAKLILQDAVLAGNVLRRANSSYYRQHNAPIIESMDRAIAVLGLDGLRVPVAAAVMQPVFKTPTGLFDKFAPITWQLAHTNALAAQHYARQHHCGDPFIAHLAALLNGLGRLVLFRLTLDAYRQRGDLLPRAEVFAQAIQTHERRMSREIAVNWEMSPGFIAALDAQLEQQLPTQMQPLARALYYGELAGLMQLLVSHEQRTQEDWMQVMSGQGLDTATIDALWQALEQDGR
jgi:HD-like signal output (HDOD) protein